MTSRTTGVRWEKEGRIRTQRIYGKKFVSDEEIARFFREGAEIKKANPSWFGQPKRRVGQRLRRVLEKVAA